MPTAPLSPTALTALIDEWLEPQAFKDYCPNGLQLDADRPIAKMATGVTANQAFIEAAIDHEVDAVLVHHGWFWKGEAAPLTGVKGRRARSLFNAGISLLAYHLPLDAHPTLGNNAELARLLGWQTTGALNPDERRPIGNLGQCAPQSHDEFAAGLTAKLGQSPLVIAGHDRPISRVAWCTGAAQSYFGQAIEQGVDVFVTGEISEPMVHLARESGVSYVAAGHHATERYGVQALGRKLSEEYGLAHTFIDIDSPV